MCDWCVDTHNGTITIQAPDGRHRTFRIRRQPDNHQFAPGQRVLSLLTGPDKWTGFAFVTRDGIKLWRRFQTSAAYIRFTDLLDDPEFFTNSGYKYLFESRCRVCDRKLTTPESIRTGIGPVCGGRE